MSERSARHPRLAALLLFLGAGAAMVVMVYFGFMERSKGVFLAGIAGIASGVGLAQLVWPPRRPEAGEEGGDGWARAGWPQRILWILGGVAGVVATAVVQTIFAGHY